MSYSTIAEIVHPEVIERLHPRLLLSIWLAANGKPNTKGRVRPMSYSDLADALEVDATHLSRWINGTPDRGNALAARIEKLTGIPKLRWPQLASIRLSVS